MENAEEFPVSPVIRTPCIHCWGPVLIPGQGAKILQVMCHGQEKPKHLGKYRNIRSEPDTITGKIFIYILWGFEIHRHRYMWLYMCRWC